MLSALVSYFAFVFFLLNYDDFILYSVLLLLLGKEIRDFVMYVYVRKFPMHLFYKSLNLTVESCHVDEPPRLPNGNISSSNNSSSYKVQLDFNQFYDTLLEMNGAHWLPVYMDNTNWAHIEFVCSIRLGFMLLASDGHLYTDDFKFVRFILSTNTFIPT